MAVSYIDELPKNNYLLEGAIAALDYLKDKYTLHIITNGFKDVQHIKLKNSGIYSYFKTITSSEEVGLKKPNPVIFKEALEQAGVSKEKTLMIGDNFEADILGAEAVGMKTLFYNYRRERVPVGYVVINSLIEIKNYL
jgi:putative hydrolase of the HAD superfamily